MLVQEQFQAVLPEGAQSSSTEMSSWNQNHWLSLAACFLLSLHMRSQPSILLDARSNCTHGKSELPLSLSLSLVVIRIHQNPCLDLSLAEAALFPTEFLCPLVRTISLLLWAFPRAYFSSAGCLFFFFFLHFVTCFNIYIFYVSKEVINFNFQNS
uniref:HSPC157 n=1 Tax=Homo sapiens TaxID=9606 RepID=Q9P007_HUMAN|nr:HSPC157 [Homo sapiens]